MSNAERYARELLKSVQNMIASALQPFDEQERRTAGLLAQTRDEIGRDRQANHETERDLRATMRAILDRVESIEKDIKARDNYHKHERVRFENLVHKLDRDLATTADAQASSVDALAKRVALLESGRTGHMALRHGPPPGVPPFPIGSGGSERAIDRVFPPYGEAFKPDPTTDAIERLARERDGLRVAAEEMRSAAMKAERECEEKQHVIVRRNERINGLTAEVTAAEKRAKDAERVLADRVNDGLRIADELRAKLTESSARIRDLEQQAQRRTGIDERRLAKLAELEGK
ncbi:MAG TPA: hypothetical protein VMZ53_03710 [Kofleriaceae bacterium]|nr:hypothetical protein [Kofleriaceae bacterium]